MAGHPESRGGNGGVRARRPLAYGSFDSRLPIFFDLALLQTTGRCGRSGLGRACTGVDSSDYGREPPSLAKTASGSADLRSTEPLAFQFAGVSLKEVLGRLLCRKSLDDEKKKICLEKNSVCKV